MVELILLVVVGTSIWVAFDAPQHGESWTWGLGCLALWIIAFPWYLSVRSRARANLIAHSRPSGEGQSARPEASPTPPPGWYRDPRGEAAKRYWDGQGWTDSVSSND